MDEFRDTQLGEQLEIVTEPDHGPDYWDRMRAQVVEAAAERRQRPSVARRLRAALGRRRPRVAIAAAALAAAVAAAVLLGLPRTPGPEAVSAAAVLKRALSAVSSGRTWQADVMMKATDWNRSLSGHHYDVWRYHMVQSADGSYLLTQLGPTRRLGSGGATSRRVTDIVAYDAATGILRHLKPGRRLSVVRDAPLGPPDRWASPLTGVDMGASLRALQAAGALELEKTEIDGRQAWTVTCTKGTPLDFPSGSGQDIDWPVYKVTVDAQTWLPVRFQQVTAGTLTAELRIRDVRVNEPLQADTFVLRPPRGLRVTHADGGFRRVKLEDAGTFAAATPLVPRFRPQRLQADGRGPCGPGADREPPAQEQARLRAAVLARLRRAHGVHAPDRRLRTTRRPTTPSIPTTPTGPPSRGPRPRSPPGRSPALQRASCWRPRPPRLTSGPSRTGSC